MFPLHYIPQILYTDSVDKELITCVKSFLSNIYPLTRKHLLHTDDRQTDDILCHRRLVSTA